LILLDGLLQPIAQLFALEGSDEFTFRVLKKEEKIVCNAKD
jgi:hypothetical protein